MTRQGPGELAELLLAQMTTQEKVAQLGSLWWRDPAREAHAAAEAGVHDVAPLEAAFRSGQRTFEDLAVHGLGQLTRVYGTYPIEVAQGQERLAGFQRWLRERTRLGIPAVAHEECLTGLNVYRATVYPTPLAWAATFDPDLVEKMGAAVGRDLRALGVHQGLAPVMDVVRDPRWGRVEETMGEDPYLVGTIGTAYVRGVESQGVVATLKHFAGYAASRGARNHAPSAIGPREMSDVVLPPFEMAIREGGARSVMNSYADVDGLPPAADAGLLTDLLRTEWGFEGTVVSDYWAVTFLETTHRLVEDSRAAAALALRAGIDVELPNLLAYGDLVDLVEHGEIPVDLLDRAVVRVLRQKSELGLLDEGTGACAAVGDEGGDETGAVDLDPPGNRDLARRLAERSVVLLRDTGRALPLGAASGGIAVVGPVADLPHAFLGCYSFPNHVLDSYPELGLGVDVPSLLTSLRAALPASPVAYEPGCDVREPGRDGIAAAVAAAREADVCVLAVGDRPGLFGRGTSGEGCDATDLSLPGVQGELVDAVVATGTPVVLVVVSGRPYALGRWADRCEAVVQAFLPGEEGGPALAGVLAGTATAGGRLPVSIPRDPVEGQPWTYLAPLLGHATEGISSVDPTPLFPFGFGLGAGPVEYGGLELSAAVVPAGGHTWARVTVTNEAEHEVSEVVQLYFSDPAAQVTRPLLQLLGYQRVTLPAGAARTVEFRVHTDRFAYTGPDRTRVVDPGRIVLRAGPHSGDLPAVADLTVAGEVTPVSRHRVLTTPAVVRDAARQDVAAR